MGTPRCYLLDIEGTTTPVDFVYKTLFPFARQEMSRFLEGNFKKEPVVEALAHLRDEHAKDERSESDVPVFEETPEAVSNYCLWLMDRDRKATGLKMLQGLIWQDGYDSGALKSVIYDDVLPALKRWKERGASICIYSSGSVLAQKLLFGHTQHGDVRSFLSAYFDTKIGGKKQQESYERIAKEIALPPEDICFLTDVQAEYDAAIEAGMASFILLRDGAEAPTNVAPDKTLQDFSELP